jgi:hypothetical protein
MGDGIGKRAMKNSLSALERIQRLEGLVSLLNEDRMKFIEAVNGAVAQQSEKASTLEGVVNAIVEVVDKTTSQLVKGESPFVNPGTVIEVLKNHLAIRHAAQIERDQAAIKAMVEIGSLTVADAIAEDSLIVGEEHTGGTGPGWTQMEFGNVLPDFQPLLIGKVVGDVVQLGAHTLAIKEIYKVHPKQKAPIATKEAPEAPSDPNAMVGGYMAQEFSEASATDSSELA